MEPRWARENLPFLVPVASGERPSDMAEELRFQQGLREWPRS